jgi:K+-transporting ATPase KdpF subunit
MLDIVFIGATALFFVICSSLRSRVRAPETGETGMSLGNAILLFISVLMCGYLLYALLKAEEF